MTKTSNARETYSKESKKLTIEPRYQEEQNLEITRSGKIHWNPSDFRKLYGLNGNETESKYLENIFIKKRNMKGNLHKNVQNMVEKKKFHENFKKMVELSRRNRIFFSKYKL